MGADALRLVYSLTTVFVVFFLSRFRFVGVRGSEEASFRVVESRQEVARREVSLGFAEVGPRFQRAGPPGPRAALA